ncbi:hypothetical protein ELH50_01255 [Rhizobium ruizarguesonis]|uniref:hypothetical protein n=1 Tax=Rhizobium TaxID=379 RepID=UPI0010322168|nr:MULTISPECIES: hypothetical protein [Rhizobium]TAU81964.1 hypothetical protein ELI40_00980 [Rhizobium leguminosarum]TBB09824.1 hypothetical protein ELH50_01255 [Rhizobium ruizarguesonis]
MENPNAHLWDVTLKENLHMDHGFTFQHFTLLDYWGGRARQKGLPENDQAYEILHDAYEATARWAQLLQEQYFPQGRRKILQRPTDQSNKFKPYTWARIYPTLNSPQQLAYTVGIDAVGEFCVKIDTVNAPSKLRAKYEAVRGPNYQDSAISAVISPDTGLAMSLEDLVDWSAQQISQFGMTYSEVAYKLELVSPALQLVTDQQRTKTCFEQWLACLVDGAEQLDSMWWQRDRNVFFRHALEGDRIEVELGLDPHGRNWAVQINEPRVAGSNNPTASIAVDQTGARFLLRQGRLQPNARRAVVVKGNEFVRMTGLRPVEIDGTLGRREWFLVAALDEPAGAIRRKTADFVERCWAVYIPEGAATGKPFPSSFGDQTSKEEKGGSYVVPAKQAIDEKLVTRRHGDVWRALTSLLSTHGLNNYWKGRTDGGFEIDLEVIPPKRAPLLIEIKTGTATSDIYTGLGQLLLYRRLFPHLTDHHPVLLVPEGIRPQMRDAILACGVFPHTYQLDASDADAVEFSADFLAICGVP